MAVALGMMALLPLPGRGPTTTHAPEPAAAAATPIRWIVPVAVDGYPEPPPAPAAPTLPVYDNGRQLDPALAAAVFAVAGWPPAILPEALAVACGIGNPRWPFGESNCNPFSVGDGGQALGLLQIHRSPWAAYCGIVPEALLDALENARCGWAIYQYEQARGYPKWSNWAVKPY